jgi:hypothetical protein
MLAVRQVPLGILRRASLRDTSKTNDEVAPVMIVRAAPSAVVVNFGYAFAPATFWRSRLLAFTGVRKGAAEDRVALCGQSAHQPIRLDRIIKPGLSPAVGYTGLHGTGRHLPAVGVEQRQLAPGLRQTALQISALRLGRPLCCLTPIALWVLAHRQCRSITSKTEHMRRSLEPKSTKIRRPKITRFQETCASVVLASAA